MDPSGRVQRIHINVSTKTGISHILLEKCYEPKGSCNRRNKPHIWKRIHLVVAGHKFLSRGRIR